MSMNISVGSTNPTPAGDWYGKVESAAKSNTESDHLQGDADSNLASIQTSSELKQAVSEGVHVSTADQQLIKAIDRANKVLEGRSVSFDISIHKATKQVLIKVLDKDTGELIREVPPEKTLDMAAKLMEMAGILIDEKR